MGRQLTRRAIRRPPLRRIAQSPCPNPRRPEFHLSGQPSPILLDGYQSPIGRALAARILNGRDANRRPGRFLYWSRLGSGTASAGTENGGSHAHETSHRNHQTVQAGRGSRSLNVARNPRAHCLGGEGVRPSEGSNRDLPRGGIFSELPAEGEGRGGDRRRPPRWNRGSDPTRRQYRPYRRRQDLRPRSRPSPTDSYRRAGRGGVVGLRRRTTWWARCPAQPRIVIPIKRGTREGNGSCYRQNEGLWLRR